ncbi:hypothetical protein SDC9_78667 [bioreactor metagenome]|uniref:Uncharacterized protein n=1 Tax=bioreactor metagenome TaxID=1076179 RepID=A0A644YVS6_9ZZZZ
MTVPAEGAPHEFAAHGLIARHHVLDRAGQQMAVVRHPGGKGRTVVKYEFFPALALPQRFGKTAGAPPEIQHPFLKFRERDLTVDRFEHKTIATSFFAPGFSDEHIRVI